MGCCGSKDDWQALKKDSELYKAQSLKKTLTGDHIINQKSTKKAMIQKEVEKILSDSSTPEDFLKVFGPPFNACNKLTPNLYLTGIGGLTKENIENYGITQIINATYEWVNVIPPGGVCFRVPVDDGEKDDISVYFDEVSEQIELCAKSGGKTIVHCMAGASRSTTLVLAYLVKYQRISLKNAFHSVKKRRETARPNINFWDQLIRYEIKIKGQSSVRMLRLTIDNITVTVPDIYKRDYPEFYDRESNKQLEAKKFKLKNPNIKTKSEKQFNDKSLTWE